MKYTLDVPEKVLDAITTERTAFHGFHDLLTAGGNYRPSIDVRDPLLELLADAYDLAQAVRIDPRRAYRYGGVK